MSENPEYMRRNHYVVTAHQLKDRLMSISTQMRQRRSVPMFLVDDMYMRLQEAEQMIIVANMYRDEVPPMIELEEKS